MSVGGESSRIRRPRPVAQGVRASAPLAPTPPSGVPARQRAPVRPGRALARYALELGARPLGERVPCAGHPLPRPAGWTAEDERNRVHIERGIRRGAKARAEQYAKWRRA